MDLLNFFILFIAILVVIFLIKKAFNKAVVKEYENGLLYKNGTFVRVLPAGGYWINGWNTLVTVVDRRIKTETIPGQEVLSKDHIGLKISLGIKYEIEIPEKAIHLTESFHGDLYQTAQIALRSIIGSHNIDDVLEMRPDIGKKLLQIVEPEAQKIGLKIHLIEVKDIMFPGDLKKIFAEEIKARKEGQAALERARGESASLRKLANAAKMLENNPALMDLRVLQSLQGSGNGNGNIFITRLPRSSKSKDKG